MRDSTRKSGFFAVLFTVVCTLAWLITGTARWIDEPFPGFLVLANGVVASAGLTHWPAVSDGSIFQSKIESYDGIEFRSPEAFKQYIASKPAGYPVAYLFGGLHGTKARIIETRRFTRSDAFLLFGVMLFSAIALLSVSLAIGYVAPDDPASTGPTLALAITGIFALTAVDLYGPYHFFRLHALAECFLGAGGVHMALVFPQKTSIASRHPRTIQCAYFASATLALANQVYLFDPRGYTATHIAAMSWAALAFSAIVLTQIHAFIWPVNYAARQRVAILALGTFASITPAVLVAAGSSISGGEAPENLISWTGAFFPIAVGYAVLKSDVLDVDSILRRTANYVLLSILVGSIYTIFITITDRVLRDSLPTSKPLAIVAFSIFLTFVVLPIRDRLQRLVDRVFFRSTYDFRSTVESASNQLSRLIDLDLIRDRLTRTIRDTLNPDSITLTVYPKESQSSIDPKETEQMRSTPQDTQSGGIEIEFHTRDRTVAHLSLGRKLSGNFYTGMDRGLLKVLANQGSIAIENALAVEQLQEMNRNLENRVSERTKELASALDDLTSTQKQLLQAERLAAVGELAAGVAHEINNPLNFARNSLRALQKLVLELAEYSDAISTLQTRDAGQFKSAYDQIQRRFDNADIPELTDDIKQLAEILESGLDRTARLVQDLRDFANPRRVPKTAYLASSLVSEAVSLINATARERGITILQSSPTAEPHLEGDPQSISQALLNILKNATDALEETPNGEISISITAEHALNAVVIRIHDNGPGLDPEVRDRVFEPFVSTKPPGKGTGLGLALCKRVIHDHQGEIRIDTGADSGTTVQISLPINRDDAAPA